MAIGDDFTVDYINKRIYHSSGTTVYSVNDLYTEIQDTFDELDQMDDDIPMSAQTPTAYTLTNGWFIDDTSIKFLNGGALETSGYTSGVILVIPYTQSTEFVPSDRGKTITGTSSGDTGTILDYNTVTAKVWVRADVPGSGGDEFDQDEAYTVASSSGAGTLTGTTTANGEDLYSNMYTLGSITDNPPPQAYIFQAGEAIDEWWIRDEDVTNGHIDVIIKVKEAGSLIAAGEVTVFGRHSGDLFDHFPIDLSAGGRNAVPLATATDLNNTSGEYYLFYDGHSSDFVLEELIEGATSGATGEVIEFTEWTGDTDGYIVLGNVKGTFQDDETLRTYAGSPTTRALANGTLGDTYIAYDTETEGFTTLGQTISGSATSATRLLRGVQDDGATGKLCLEVPSTGQDANDYKDYLITDTITGSSEGSADVTATSTTIATGHTDIQISWVNGAVTHGGISGGPFTANEVVTWDSANESGVFLLETAGTMTLGNCTTVTIDTKTILGTVSGASCAATQDLQLAHTMSKAFQQQSSYNYDAIIDCANRPLIEVYEYTKYSMRENSTFACFPLKYESASLGFNNLDGEEYIRGYTDIDTPGNSYAPVKSAPIGTFAGGVLFGARGVWIENMDSGDSQNFQLLDSDNAVHSPPNFQAVKVTGLVSGDRVSVFETTGAASTTILKTKYTSHATNNTSGGSTFETTGNIEGYTPGTGFVRVVNISIPANPPEYRYAYTSWTGKIFTLSGTLTQTYDSTDKAYIPFIDKETSTTEESVTVIYSADVYALTRVRIKGIIPFQAPGTFVDTGMTQGAIRTPDGIVS